MTRRACSTSSATQLAALVAIIALTISACAGTSAQQGRTGGAAEADGALVSKQPLTSAAALPSASSNELVTYTSRDAADRPVVVSGAVSTPTSPPPPGGWPVVSWGHGTTGVTDACAPTADTASGPVHDYLSTVDPTLDSWVQRGYAVLRTDYEGLGTSGPHPYLNARSAANALGDLVRAAHGGDSRIGPDWVAMGHSQGGQAALSAAATRPGEPDLTLRGAVSIAPGGVGFSRTAEYVKAHPDGPRTALAFLPLVLLGAAAADPAVRPEQLLADEAKPLLTTARTGCLSDLRETAGNLRADQVFRPDADLRPLTTYLRKQDPIGFTARVPTLIAQGTEDAAVAKPGTDALVRELCGEPHRTSYETYAADHRGSVPASRDDAQRFVDALFAGRTPETSC